MTTSDNGISSGQSQQLISIVRRPRGLVALVCAPVSTAEPETAQVSTVELNAVRRSRESHRLKAAWHHLAQANAEDADTLYDLLVVLLETVPDLSCDRSQLPLPREWEQEIAPIRATQAHPRAYKGTKYKPPKESPRRTIDIRPYLCDPGSIQKILSPLWKWLPQVRQRLEQSGYSNEMIDVLERELPSTRDTSTSRQKKHWSFPPRFLRCIWPFLRWKSTSELSEYLSLYAKLNLEHDETLLAAISLLIASSGTGLACLWSKIASRLPAHRRTIFILDLVHTKAYLHELAADTTRHVEQLNSLASDQQFPTWIRCFLAGIHDRVSEEYLLAGFRLAARFRPGYRFDTVGQCISFPEQVVEELAIELADRDSHSGWLPMALWERCAQLPGFAGVIRSSQWRGFRPAAHRYFEFLQGIAYHEGKWTEIRRQIPKIEKLLLSVPDTHQVKAIACLADWLWLWDEPAVIAERLLAGYRLLRRIASPPFGISDGASGALHAFLGTESEDVLQQFLTAPDTSFEALESACVRGNDAGLISWGSHALTRTLGEFTVVAFRSAPKKLFRAAKSLGVIPFPARLQVIKGSREHPFFQADLLHVPIAEACETIERSLGKAHTNPIPARLRAWLKGEVNLSAGSLERHRRVLAEKLILTRLDLIEQSVLEWLKHGFPIQKVTKNDEHALRLLGSLDDNRRGLRKFLNAYWSGNQDYLSKHPETIAWYRKHPAIFRKVWEHGIPFESKGIALTIERDPLEILKLGTYAGSCLGIGGICAYSAAAVLLDVNKQVLYARDREGKVVGRQLLAISDDNRLICFHVYPLSSTKPVKDLFLEYDHALARALGISIYDPANEDTPDYKVSSVLSVFWWDDSSWDFNTGE